MPTQNHYFAHVVRAMRSSVRASTYLKDNRQRLMVGVTFIIDESLEEFTIASFR